MSSADAPVPARPAGSASYTIAGFAIGKLEIALALNAAAFIVARLTGVSLLLELLLLGAVVALGTAVVVKLLRNTIRQLIWRLRNRLIVAYVFIGVIPVLAMLALVGATSQYLGGQVGAYLVHSELERRLTALNAAARSLAQAAPDRRPMLLDRIESFYRERFPNLTVIVADEGRTPPEAPPRDWGEIHGIVVKDGLLYAWARSIHEQTQVTLLAPLTRRWLADLTPNLGGVSVVHFPDPDAASRRSQPLTMRPHPPAGGEEDDPAVIPPPVNRFDVELLGGSNLPVALWESPQVLERSLLAVHSRLSAVLHILFEQKQPVEAPLYFFAALFLIAEIISVYIGVSITRTITGAVHDLYEGTERVMRGDFSHRIPVRGKEQIAELSSSFNRMTENLEHLLEVAKEKERMQAELEIAREVQNQLFPRSVPALKCLELGVICKPARMVSGDYYDYPSLSDGRIAIALGDVAGKGISAALLMATLQSSVRTQVRHLQESGKEAREISTSTMVSRLNQQLYEDTSPEKFATFCFAVYDDATGRLTYTNAGHLPPLLLRQGEVFQFDINGMVVGAFPFAKYDESSVVLEPGDLLVFYTDGIVEPENEFGEMFGEQQLKDLLLRSAHLETEQIINLVIEAVQRHTGSPELQDDMTILVARRT